MYNSEDYKREKNKSSKSELVNVSLGNYLQRRNYATFQPSEITKAQLRVHSSVDNEVSNPNSIEYKSYTCDPVIIDNNFAKFISWLRELSKEESYSDIEILIGPLFCHLYLDIFQAGLGEEASVFFFNHLSAVEKLNRDKYIQDLISCFSEENSISFLKEEFRSNKYSIQISENSRERLINFVEEECHITFLQVFQTWFEISVMSNQSNELKCDSVPNECCLNAKFEKIVKVAADLENEHNKLVYSVDVSDVITEINCGFLSRQHGMFGYNQGNIVCIQPLHNFNNLSSINDSKLVKLNGHSTRLYAITISRNYFASSSSDGKICIYKIENFEVVKECLGHIKTVYSLKISSNEFYLASGSEDNTIRLWNLENGQFLRIFVGHEQAVSCLDFHPNCLYFMSGSADKNIRMWNIENGNP
ncbi:hypothetical protein WA026_001261 [Henosepilachna vigintioctopunctata]|uniref:TFIID subunit TAF5 NTD2 domain-containing protein n=1 Tax=Henosepilachna vigintioctopunctata TaxID=420089 RepID=A0AAW1URA0_9CUCU